MIEGSQKVALTQAPPGCAEIVIRAWRGIIGDSMRSGHASAIGFEGSALAPKKLCRTTFAIVHRFTIMGPS
eukprot:8421915-Pyramimonas_sp.AAC.1